MASNNRSGKIRTMLGIAALLLMPQLAHAIPLDTLLAPGGSLWSDDGALHFAEFSIHLMDPIVEEDNALIGLDLGLVDVSVVNTGPTRVLEITGPFEVIGGDLGQMRIHYQVKSAAGFQIVGVGLSVEGELAGPFAAFEMSEKITGDATASLFVLGENPGPGILGDAAPLTTPANGLEVDSELWLSGDPGQVHRIAQAFEVRGPSAAVPEPSSGLLFAAGILVAAARVGRQRATRSAG